MERRQIWKQEASLSSGRPKGWNSTLCSQPASTKEQYQTRSVMMMHPLYAATQAGCNESQTLLSNSVSHFWVSKHPNHRSLARTGPQWWNENTAYNSLSWCNQTQVFVSPVERALDCKGNSKGKPWKTPSRKLKGFYTTTQENLLWEATQRLLELVCVFPCWLWK